MPTVSSLPDGSSPLARGTRARSQRGDRVRRFIPARAGNTSASATRLSATTVHPRSRGEHNAMRAPNSARHGSSPLARGTPGRGSVGIHASRFIPARAGNTSGTCCWRSRRSVHPRSRGEHAPQHLRPQPLFRFIPARAGNTIRPGDGPLPSTVHPRSRGEHARVRQDRDGYPGSSPLARGTHLHPQPGQLDHRFIPARAGNTIQGTGTTWTASVHPRSRGEHRDGARHLHVVAGSSPLARGTRTTSRGGAGAEGFIPASRGEHYSICA